MYDYMNGLITDVRPVHGTPSRGGSRVGRLFGRTGSAKPPENYGKGQGLL